MSIRTIVTRGYGSYGLIKFVVTRGYATELVFVYIGELHDIILQRKEELIIIDRLSDIIMSQDEEIIL